MDEELAEEFEALRPPALKRAVWVRQLLRVGVVATRAARRSGLLDRRAKRGERVVAEDE